MFIYCAIVYPVADLDEFLRFLSTETPFQILKKPFRLYSYLMPLGYYNLTIFQIEGGAFEVNAPLHH